MTKQEKIKEAYGENFDYFKGKIDSNGWIKDRDFWGAWPENMNKINWETKDHDNDYYDVRRPLELKGIEYNNDWIKIESENDLPEVGGDYYIFNEKVEIYTYLKDNRWLSPYNSYPKSTGLHGITHYKKMVIPEPPIY